ncbi:MAG: aldehyde dehydrogenase family protein [Gammaproteobacteria bacterium]|nr:aldehyde dehydrogenase family protein [Gammaproteobacteria bacterium]
MQNLREAMKTLDYGVAPESTAQVSEWLEAHGRVFGHFIDGEFINGTKRTQFETRNPASGEVLAKISQADKKIVNIAVAAAGRAQAKWASLPGFQRGRYLYAIARLIQKHSRLFAVLESLDNGKPIRESRTGDIPLVIRHFYHHAGWAQLLESEFSDYEAIGVAGQIIPWNFPLLMLAWKIAPALACGNTVVLKPAEYTSLTALLFAEICQQAKLPQGVVNIITGDGASGALLSGHPDIQKVAFTGSTVVGRRIREQTAGSGKKLTLELGGKSPFIVFDDADMDSAIEGLVDAIWFNQGQVCCAGSRLLVQEGIADQFHTRLRSRMDKLRVGDPLDKSVDLGAIVDPVQHEQIDRLVTEGVAQGASIYQATGQLPDKCPVGSFYPPTLLTGVESSDMVAQEEIFGPVLVSMTYRTPAEAVALANNVRYGLAASIWTENINLALDIAPKVHAGVVWINCTNQFDAATGFGGVKESGYGREGGREGLFEYLKLRFEANLKTANPATGTRLAVKADPSDDIDKTPKFYVGGKQVRPDSGYSRAVSDHKGQLAGFVGEGNRKDIRNAVEAARKASSWTSATAHSRAQVLYYLAENMSARQAELAGLLQKINGYSRKRAQTECQLSIQRLFYYAAWADKYDGDVHAAPIRGVTIAMKEASGIIGIACPEEQPLLGIISLLAPAIVMGNRVVMVTPSSNPLLASVLYQILDTSDVPGGVVNLIQGDRNTLSKTLADHYEVDHIWYFGDQEGSTMVEAASAASLKRTWVNYGKVRNWADNEQGQGQSFLRQSTEIKNIWVPYGE